MERTAGLNWWFATDSTDYAIRVNWAIRGLTVHDKAINVRRASWLQQRAMR